MPWGDRQVQVAYSITSSVRVSSEGEISILSAQFRIIGFRERWLLLSVTSFDYLVSAGEERRWQADPKCLGDFEIDVSSKMVGC